MSNIYETIKWNLIKNYFMCGRRRSPFFRCWRKEKAIFSDMWTIIMRLTRSKWFFRIMQHPAHGTKINKK